MPTTLPAASALLAALEPPESLRISGELLCTLVESAPIGMFLTRTTGECVYSNSMWTMISGLSAEDSLGYGWMQAVHPDDRAKVQESWLDTSARGEKFETEYRAIPAIGDVRWMHVLATPQGDATGTVVAYVGSVEDITERKRTDQALRDSQERLALATRAGGVGIWDWTRESGKLWWDDSMFLLYGLNREDFSGAYEAWRDRLHPDDLARADAEAQAVMSGTKRSYDTEFRVLRPDGEIRHIKSHADVICDERGGVQRLVGTNWDITERKRAEEALRESHERLERTLEASSTGTWRVDLRTGMDTRDASLNRMLGLPAEPSTQPLNDWFSYLHPGDLPSMRLAWEEGLISGEYNAEHRLVRRDGTVLWVHDRGVMVRDSAGQVSYAIGAAMDITERMQAVNELRLHANILQNLYEGVYLIRASDGVILYTNPAFERMFGYAPGELIGQNVSVVNAPTGQSPEEAAAQVIRQLNETGVWQGEFLNIKKDGTTFWSHATAKTHQHPEFGAVWISMHQDITERKKSEESMRMAASIYQASSEAIMVTDENNRIIDINPAFTHITGYSLAEVAGMDPNVLQSGLHDPAFYQEMWQEILNKGHWQGEIWDRRKDGESYAKWATISAIRHPDGTVYRHIAQFSDITEKKRKDELIRTQANFDPLTNLPNRRLFQDRLELEIRKAQRTGLPLALLLIDLDRFKEINDTLGHAKGDVLLVEAGRRISGCVHDADTVARLGGDEFTVILPEFRDRAHIERIAQNIIEELSKPFSLGEGDMGYISATIGITLYPDDAKDLVSLLKHVDQAMYRAKGEGRGRFGYFTQFMQLEAQEKRVLTDELRQALARGELHVYYQPIVELASGRIVKAEALLRWKHPQRGMISPATFIPLAEESRLILEIGEWVFRQASASVERWRRRYGRTIQVSVNKSPVQFMHPAPMAWADILLSLGLPGNSVTVEITEGLLLKDSSKVKQRLLEFRNSGIEVSIDDFGTGFSSLSYLKQFDIDYLKIDRSFISDLAVDPGDKALTEAIIVMAHKLDIETIAEGVETEEQRDMLAAFGCDYVQGFLYSPAVSAEEFEKMLEQ